MNSAPQIVLSDPDGLKLEALARSRTTAVRLAQRAQIVLKAATGMLNKDIARELEIMPNNGLPVARPLCTRSLFGNRKGPASRWSPPCRQQCAGTAHHRSDHSDQAAQRDTLEYPHARETP